MQQSVRDERMSYPRHFSDVFGGFSDSQDGTSGSEDVNKLKRRPKCKTRNKHTDGSCVPLCDDYYKESLFAMPYSTVSVIVPSLTNGSSASCGMDQLKLAGSETSKCMDISVPRMESLPVFDILCSSLRCSENVTAHQAAALSRWLCRRAVKTANDNDSLVKLLMASKCPVVSLVCCRMLKQSCLMSNIMSCSSATTADVISYVLLLQREMVKFLETGQFSMKLMNVICLLDCIAAMCHDIPAYCNKLHFSGHFHSRWCSNELRWAMLSVISLANVISSKVKLTSTNSRAAGTDLNDGIQSIRWHVERVPQIVGAMLSTSVYCEVAQVWSISRILNEYWHATDFCQRRLIVDSVLVPKLRMELCTMILAEHCDVLLQECFTTSLSLDDIFSIFVENVVISAITQRLWMEDDGVSVVRHCREICFILCNAVCSYILHQKGESVSCLLKCLLFSDRNF